MQLQFRLSCKYHTSRVLQDDILSLGKMAIELVLGPQVSDEQVMVEKEIPSLLNQFSQNFRSIVTSCLQKDPKYVRMLVYIIFMTKLILAYYFLHIHSNRQLLSY